MVGFYAAGQTILLSLNKCMGRT